jgi:hypothetical protein
MMMFPQLGRAITLAFRRAGLRVERFTEALIRGRGGRVIASSHLDGRRVARSTTGVLLRASPTLSVTEARRWRDGSAAYAERALALTQTVLAAEPTRAALTAYAALVLQQSVWAGNDAEARTLAIEHDAAWKEWVRAFPREAHRDHHDLLEGRIIPTDALFELPGGRNAGTSVYGPRDWGRLSDPGEWVECGHALRFSRTAERRRVTN